eukprot:346329_1
MAASAEIKDNQTASSDKLVAEVIYTNDAKQVQNKSDIFTLNARTLFTVDGQDQTQDNFVVYLSKKEKLKNMFAPIIQFLQNKYFPMIFKIDAASSKSYNRSITECGASFLANIRVRKGLPIHCSAKYEHRILNEEINCKYMRAAKSEDPLKCPIYYAVKEKYELTQNYLNHLNEFIHFKDEMGQKPACKYNDECKAYKRMEAGGNTLNDECHIKLYRHPPRKRYIKLSQNIRAFVMNTKNNQNSSLYYPTSEEMVIYHQKNRFLFLLIEEVINNGFKSDLCLECGVNDECKHDDFSILKVVDDKMDHIRHKKMGQPLKRDEMLALILYTGCECNYDLCASQRKGDYKTWKFFDWCLWNAISSLSDRETGMFSVFTGLNGVKLNKKEIECGYFKTYVSTSWKKEVATTFIAGNEGMLIQIDQKFKNKHHVNCCDVSWISKFPDECEVLFTRSRNMNSWGQDFKCVVLNESNGIQTVLLKNTDGWD